MKKILGISCFYHDSAAALIIDGEIIAAAQEERFTRKKHDASFPKNAINYCLEEAYLDQNELDAVIFYDNPFYSFDRFIKTIVSVYPRGKQQWFNSTKRFLNTKLNLKRNIYEFLKVDVPVYVTRHHLSHAASAFFPSPFKQAAILTVDGVGEWATTSISYGNKSNIKTLKEIRFPHSIGLLYSAFTYYCGFKVNSGEYKLMGLAPYGEPKYVKKIKDNIVFIKDNGSFRLNLDYFGYLNSQYMINDDFNNLFGGMPRAQEATITSKYIDIAASIQQVTEEIMLGLVMHSKEITSSNNLCLAGGVALNCVSNGLIQQKKIFDNIWIQPASGDAGGAIGSALASSFMYFNVPRKINTNGDSQKGSYLGPSYTMPEVIASLEKNNAVYEVIKDRKKRSKLIAKSIAEGKVVGLMSGRMEFGPRALGARSILGDPRNPETQTIMNLKIKYRESFRPFAPSVLKEKASEWFNLKSESPYMLCVATVSEKHQLPLKIELEKREDLFKIVSTPRSSIPAVTHVDYSARIQTVDKSINPEYHAIISEFYELTGCPLVVNTSFNVRGEPIVCSPDDAFRCFMRTEMDILVIEGCILYKESQIENSTDKTWMNEYELD